MRNRARTGLFAALILVGCLAGIIVPAGLNWDFANFYDAGRRVAAGQADDLYHPKNLIAGQPPQGRTGFFGAPISAVLYVPLAGLSPDAALVWFKIQNVAAFLASFALLFGFYRRFARPEPAPQWEFAAIFMGLCLIFQPFWSVFRVGGQTTPTVLLLLAVALVAHTNGRFWASAVAVGIAAIIKPALAPLLIYLLCVSGIAFFWRLVVVLSALGGLSVLAFGVPVHQDFLELMRASGRITYEWYLNSSLFVLVDHVGIALKSEIASGPYQSLIAVLTYSLQIVAIAAIAWLGRSAYRHQLPAPALRHLNFLIAILLFLFWSRTLWEHYLSLMFIPLLYVVAVRRRFSRSAIGLVAAIFALSIFQNLIFTSWLRATFAFESLPALFGIALFKCAPLLLLIVLLSRHWREFLDSHRVWTAR